MLRYAIANFNVSWPMSPLTEGRLKCYKYQWFLKLCENIIYVYNTCVSGNTV